MRKKKTRKKKNWDIYKKVISYTRTLTPDSKYVAQLSRQQTFKTLRGFKN